MEDKKILPDEIELSEIVLNKANHALELIAQEESVRMKKQKTKRMFKSQVAAIAGICILGISSVGVAAAIHHNWGRGMNGNLQANDTQQQQLTNDGVAVVYPEKEDYESLKVVQNGVAIAPNTVIVDERFAYISFTISGYSVEDGKEPGFEMVDVNSKEVELNMSGSMYEGIISDENGAPVYEDGTPIENRADGSIICHYIDENGNLEYFIQAFTADENDTILGKTLNVAFQNLGTLYKTEFTNDIDGLWEFEITLPDISSAKHFEINEQLEGTDFSIDDALISPISMKVNYTTSTKPQMNEDEIGVPEVRGVILKDGTRLPYLTNGGSVGYTDDTHAYNIAGYDRVIDVDDVQSLLILVEPGKEPVAVDIQ